MPCSVIRLPGGVTAIVKHSGPKPRRCSVCRVKVHKFVLCDYIKSPAYDEVTDVGVVPVKAKSCDVALCAKCTVHVEPDTDYCPIHAAALNINGRRLRL